MELKKRNVLGSEEPQEKECKCPRTSSSSLSFALLPMSALFFTFKSDQPKTTHSLYHIVVIKKGQTLYSGYQS